MADPYSPSAEHYTVSVTIDSEWRIVTVTSRAQHLPGLRLSFQTAWVDEDAEREDGTDDLDVPFLHPTQGHEIMLYDDQDQAIGEAMTSLRDFIDHDERYTSEYQKES